jgi:MFS transporter, ACS family, D-galactonate transporter
MTGDGLQSRSAQSTMARPPPRPVPSATDNSRLTPMFSRVLVLLFLSVFINYIDRSNLSIAAPLIKDELGISASQLGILLSAFFWTYSSCQVLSGWLVDRWDVKWVFAAGFFLWSTATAVTGLVHSLVALLLVRIVLGIGESVAYPGYSKILGVHCPEGRRGFANSIIAAGLALGPSFGMLFGGTLVAHYGWRLFFVVLGSVCLLWLGPWLRWMPATEAVRPAEVEGRPGMREIVRQRSAWGTWICLFSGNYFLYFMVTWLPFYLVRERHFSMTGMAKTGGAFFFLCALSASLCGWLSDRWILAGRAPTLVRKTFMVTGLAGSGTSLLAAVMAPGGWGSAFLMLAGVFFGFGSSNIWAIAQRLAGPQAVGRWCGLQLFVGNLAGVVAPAVTGFMLDRTGHFFYPCLIVSLVSWAGVLSWVFVVGPLEPVKWVSPATVTSNPEPVGAD